MGKNKKSSGKNIQGLSQEFYETKQVFETLNKIIHDIKSIWGIIDELAQKTTAMDNYIGLYVEWKNDNYKFNKYLEDKFKHVEMSKPKKETIKQDLKGDIKSEKRRRYNKLAEGSRE